MEMKKIVMTAAITLMTLFAVAQQNGYEVLFSNSDQIKIGGQVAKKGLRFDDKKEINMPSDKNAMEVRNLRDGTIELVVGKKYRKHKSKTLGEYLVAEKHLSTKGWGENEPYEFDTVYYMLDSLRVPMPARQSGNIVAKAIVYLENGQIEASIRRSTKYNKYCIPRTVVGRQDNSPFHLDILEKDLEKDWEYAVWRKLYVVPLPLKMD